MRGAEVRHVEVVPDAEQFEQRAVERIVETIQSSVGAHGHAVIALCGGSTPRSVYRRLARVVELPWASIEFFFGDERDVPPEHADSNFRMARETLFDPLLEQGVLPPENIHRVHGEKGAEEAASAYEGELRRVLGESLPRIDLVLLGLGADGHTASLFPRSAALSEQALWVVANRVEKLGADRITFTFPLLNHARQVLFLVRGAEKADAVARVLDAPDGPVDETPARGVRSDHVAWLLDPAAASMLRDRRSTAAPTSSPATS